MPVDPVLDGEMAFDHSELLVDALERARAKLEYSAIAASFCGDVFTIGELRRVYEAIWGVELDPANFARKVLSVRGFVEETGRVISQGPGRPAREYRLGPIRTLHPPIVR